MLQSTGDTKKFSDKQKLKEFTAYRPVLQEMFFRQKKNYMGQNSYILKSIREGIKGEIKSF